MNKFTFLEDYISTGTNEDYRNSGDYDTSTVVVNFYFDSEYLWRGSAENISKIMYRMDEGIFTITSERLKINRYYINDSNIIDISSYNYITEFNEEDYFLLSVNYDLSMISFEEMQSVIRISSNLYKTYE